MALPAVGIRARVVQVSVAGWACLLLAARE